MIRGADDLPVSLDDLVNLPVPAQRLSPVDVELVGAGASLAVSPPPDVFRVRRRDGTLVSYYRWHTADEESYLTAAGVRERLG